MSVIRRVARQLRRAARWVASLNGVATLQGITCVLVILTATALIATILDMRQARAELWEQMYFARDARARYEQLVEEEDKIAICMYYPGQERAESSEELYEMYEAGELDCG